MTSCVCCSNGSTLLTKTIESRKFIAPRGITVIMPSKTRSYNRICGIIRVRASAVDSSNFIKRMEQAWAYWMQMVWGTGLFIIGEQIMLCEVPSRNTSCVICTGKGTMCCSDCQGAGFRAKWLEEPPISK